METLLPRILRSRSQPTYMSHNSLHTNTDSSNLPPHSTHQRLLDRRHKPLSAVYRYLVTNRAFHGGGSGENMRAGYIARYRAEVQYWPRGKGFGCRLDM
ncbi:hypothetical protein BDQ17DRAFT_692138 [Cyathus striatus]|nr:hypothetical protein BDQ17DRAFT_692138 [Cyathus striatus]